MLTHAKVVQDEQESKLQSVLFLNKDGIEQEETPQEVNKTYVSVQDYNKYGKVEVYTNGNKIQQTFFLKQFRGGRPGELLVDPHGVFSKPEDLSAFTTQRGSRFCEYIKVPDIVYYSYVNYLQSRDIRYFRYCEKYILDHVK